jgi:hypothetical protein
MVRPSVNHDQALAIAMDFCVSLAMPSRIVEGAGRWFGVDAARTVLLAAEELGRRLGQFVLVLHHFGLPES